MTSNGTLKVSWLRKIANFQDSEPVELFFENSGRNESGKVNGTAMETALKSLQFGEVYRIRLHDPRTNETAGPIEIEACKMSKHLNLKVGKFYVMAHLIETTKPILLSNDDDYCK